MNYTLKNLDIVRNRILRHPEYSDKLRSELEKSLRINALGHSLRLEGIGEEINSPSKSNMLIKQQRKAYHEAFANAIRTNDYLDKYGLNLATFASLGNIIEPKTHPTKYFRSREVMFGEFGGVESEKIPYHLENLIYKIEHSEKLHPVLNAIDAHIDFIRIHPYFDGNGRTARILQDYILWKSGYPSPIIYEGERELYIDLMKFTMRDRLKGISDISNPSDSEKLLHTFISTKTLDSALEIEKKLKEKRIFKIILKNTSDPAICFTIANKIRNQHIKNEHNGTTVKITRKCPLKKQKELKILGDISSEELKLILDNYKSKGFSDYEIKPIK
ncbi:MAG: Fic family protein [Nanoarchaeota archaeon]|nr:Fic family protein [Nanoarchaeota archaeon]